MKIQISTWLQNLGIACSMASFFTLFFRLTEFDWMAKSVFNIPVLFVVVFLLGLVIAEDIRKAFKKVFWYEKRKDSALFGKLALDSFSSLRKSVR